MKQEIIDLLQQAINEKYNVKINDISLENPPKKELWDYAFGCFILSKLQMY